MLSYKGIIQIFNAIHSLNLYEVRDTFLWVEALSALTHRKVSRTYDITHL